MAHMPRRRKRGYLESVADDEPSLMIVVSDSKEKLPAHRSAKLGYRDTVNETQIKRWVFK